LRTLRTALRHRAFRTLAALYAADAFLGWFGSVALMVLVYEQTNSTAAAAGMLLCKQIAPGLILPAAGVTAERFDARLVLGSGFLVQALTLAVLAALGYGWVLFPLAVVAGTAGALVRTTLRARVAQTLAGHDFRSANASFNVIAGLAALLGPAAAAATVATVGAAQCLAATATALAFVAVGAALAAPVALADVTDQLRADESSPDASTRPPGSVPLQGLLVLAAIMGCLFAMDEPVMLAYSEHSLGSGVAGYGALYSAWGVGAIAGTLLFTRLLAFSMVRVALIAALLMSAAFIGLSAAPTIAVAVAVAVVSGIASGLGWVAIVTAIQEVSPRGQETRTAARVEAITMAGPAVGALLGGLLAEFATPRLTLLAPGVLALAVLLMAWAALRLRAVQAARPVQAPKLLSPTTSGGSA
jgi:ENTS family enterobactin (siderophore) exporter